MRPLRFVSIRIGSAIMANNFAWATNMRRMPTIGDFTHWKERNAH